MTETALVAALQSGSGIAPLDWAIVGVFLVASTVVAIAMKGRQSGVRDFFLGDRNLPWIIVCFSLIATEVSAASFVGVPRTSFTGSLTYLQLAVGAILARFVIGYLFVPEFYENGLSSPYHYIGSRLGLGAERMTRGLFVVGTLLGQAVRVYIVAVALKIITGIPVEMTIVVITLFAALWAVIGGIRTVVWTDVLALAVIVVSALAAAAHLILQTSGGLSEIFRQASAASKLQFWDFGTEPVLEFTIWTGIFGSTFNTLASHGVDHMNTQRLFCCRSAGDARKAILWSAFSQAIVIVLAFIGLGLFAYVAQNKAAFEVRLFELGTDNIFPIFIASVMPAGLKGLLVIGLLAAAISSLDSALAALSHVTSRSLYSGREPQGEVEQADRVRHARLITLAWGAVLGVAALYFQSIILQDIVVGTALRTTSFTYGALLGSMLLALLLKGRDGRGLLFAVPIAILTAFGMGVHAEAWTHWFVVVGALAVLFGWFYMLLHEAEQLPRIKDTERYVRRAWYILLAEFPRTIWIVIGLSLVLALEFLRDDFFMSGSGTVVIAWPWYLPVGTGVTVALGYLLSRPREEELAE